MPLAKGISLAKAMQIEM